MKSRIKILIIAFAMLVSCNNNDKPKESKETSNRQNHDSIDIAKINMDLKDIAHKTAIKFYDDTLSIDLFIEPEDFNYSKYYTDLIIELIVCDISKDITPRHKIKITRCYEKGIREKPELISNDMIYKILSINKIKTYYDFKKYLVKNVRGEKLMKFNSIIDNLIKNRKSKKPVNVKDNDFIQAVLSYATYYCIPEEKDDFYRKLLEAIKDVAKDKELWPDFDPNDVDYFLDYCDNSTHV